MRPHLDRTNLNTLTLALALLAGCGSSTDISAENVGDPEPLGSARSALVGTDTFLYAQCNATSWNTDDASRLRPTTDPYVWSLDYEVSQPWMVSNADNCVVTETNQYNGWGTVQNRYTTMSTNLTAPAVDRLRSGSQTFNVKYPALGRYTMKINWRAGSIDIAAASSTSTPTEWPNALSSANGDAWLRQNHDQIKLLKPRVLVIHANNAKTLADTQTMAAETAAAFREASRYHGYNDASAPVTLDYQFQYVDLTVNDPHTAPWPAAWPAAMVNGRPEFYSEKLFDPAFAAALGIKDPQDGHNLSMCELFEKGVVNEVWTQAPRIDDPVGIYESKSRAQVYDANMNPIVGVFDGNAGNGGLGTGPNGQCKVTVRFLELLTTQDRGVGCTMEAAGHGFESLAGRNVIPYLKANSDRFFNTNLNARYQLPFNSIYDYCPGEAPYASCYVYPNDHTLTLGNISPVPDWRTPFVFGNWGEGCGNPHFPPNGRSNYDFGNTADWVSSSCENYGLRNDNGADKKTLFNASLPAIQSYNAEFPDCASGWMIYLFQSVPGYANHALGADNKPMKSWMPFMFY